jgi:hypothetical protein
VREKRVVSCESEEGECDPEPLRWLALDSADTPADPLAAVIPWEYFQVCSPCLEFAKEAYTKARKELWNNLPVAFNLGSWEELID